MDEKIDHSNPVNYDDKGTTTRGGRTDKTGSVKDPWTIPFTAPTGQVTTTQHVMVNGREAVANATVHMNYPDPPTVTEPQYWAPFR